jgi:hypothetical protein
MKSALYLLFFGTWLLSFRNLVEAQTCANIAVTRLHPSTVLFPERCPGTYLAYRVASTHNQPISDVWVTLDSITNPGGLAQIALGPNENGRYKLGTLPANGGQTAFMFIVINNPPTNGQTGTWSWNFKVHFGNPNINASVTTCTTQFNYTEVRPIQRASATKPDLSSIGPSKLFIYFIFEISYSF